MDKPYFRQLFEPQLREPILVEGLTGLGNVGLIAAKHLIEYTDAKLFAEVYAPYFQDFVAVKKDGTCSPPSYQLYAAKTEKSDFIVLTGDFQPSLEDTIAHYDLCDEILDFAGKYGCRFVVTMGGVVTSKPGNEVYVAATSPELAQRHLDKGLRLYREGRIVGATGLLLGLAKKRGWQGICLLGAAAGFGAEMGVGLTLFKVLMKMSRRRLLGSKQT